MLAAYLVVTLLGAPLDAASAGEWQHVVAVPGGKEGTRAYLWIPPEANEVRGLLMGGMTLIEKALAHDPVIRAAATRAGLAILYFHPHFDSRFDYPRSGGDKRLLAVLAELAQRSGYDEIARVPWITVGHSTGGIFARNVAYWNPGRTAGVLHIKSGSLGQHLPFPGATLRGVPFLAINGQYEEFGPGGGIPPGKTLESQWHTMRAGLLAWRAAEPEHLVSLLVEPAAGHFAWSEPLARHVALFIERLAHARMPSPGEPLRPVRAADGWLTDARIEAASPAAPCRAQRCSGTLPRFWHLDRALAQATDAFHRGLRSNRREQRVTFEQDGAAMPPAARIRLRFDPLHDGSGFRPVATFWDPGQEGHASGPIRFRPLRGAVERLGDDLFRVRPDAFALTSPMQRVIILAEHPGDAQYRRTEQPAEVLVPLGCEEGATQTIDFPAPPELTLGGSAVPLIARSSSGLAVGFTVEGGPAILEGNLLRPTAVPPRSRFPLTVTVAAYQLGQSAAPSVRAATPVRRLVQVRSAAHTARR